MLNPIKSSADIKEEFISYVATRFHIADKTYSQGFIAELNKVGNIAKGPYLDINDSFKTGKTISELIGEGEMSPLFNELEPDKDEIDKEIKLERPLYLHQEEAVRKINQKHNLVVTTGTGSGKTECFILPILNHLLLEKEYGELGSGVRAIIIYPMNALAVDQMKRLRDILADYPSITFGVYNGSTAYSYEQGKNEYGEIYKDDKGHALEPLPNEIISRDIMQKEPPHILVTNYAMLEYMMLRPKDDKVFSGAKLKFLILDEAHIYRGATGMETSLLLRRLKARISNPKDVRHILTSATLGGKESNDDIVHFAETLCAAKFLPDDIIRSQQQMPKFCDKLQEFPMEIFADLA
ncbi:MAG: DEAD/DEAH box helicase, partial [Selenomonadaceae bacterium]|nr:DEAD/DEAH box helicase [Selenomonadaceae bacterium]